jgi:hypothetical protein
VHKYEKNQKNGMNVKWFGRNGGKRMKGANMDKKVREVFVRGVAHSGFRMIRRSQKKGR